MMRWRKQKVRRRKQERRRRRSSCSLPYKEQGEEIGGAHQKRQKKLDKTPLSSEPSTLARSLRRRKSLVLSRTPGNLTRPFAGQMTKSYLQETMQMNSVQF